jgi:hypothetical protein
MRKTGFLGANVIVFLGHECHAVQNPFVRYAQEAGWTTFLLSSVS